MKKSVIARRPVFWAVLWVTGIVIISIVLWLSTHETKNTVLWGAAAWTVVWAAYGAWQHA